MGRALCCANGTIGKGCNAFYCKQAQRRKTAWDTPHCLTAEDWELIRRALSLSVEEAQAEFSANWRTWEPFFDRCLGWPEGSRYCTSPIYTEWAFPGVMRNYRSKLEKALQAKGV